MELPEAAWLPDPTGRHLDRWWDGQRWTARVRLAGGVEQLDDVVRPRGSVGSWRPAPWTVATMPTGAGSARVLVAIGLAVPLLLAAITLDDVLAWVGDVADGLHGVHCEREAAVVGSTPVRTTGGGTACHD